MTYLVKIPVPTGTKKVAVVRVHDVDNVYFTGDGAVIFYTDKGRTNVAASFSQGNWLYFIEESNQTKQASQ